MIQSRLIVRPIYQLHVAARLLVFLRLKTGINDEETIDCYELPEQIGDLLALIDHRAVICVTPSDKGGATKPGDSLSVVVVSRTSGALEGRDRHPGESKHGR